MGAKPQPLSIFSWIWFSANRIEKHLFCLKNTVISVLVHFRKPAFLNWKLKNSVLSMLPTFSLAATGCTEILKATLNTMYQILGFHRFPGLTSVQECADFVSGWLAAAAAVLVGYVLGVMVGRYFMMTWALVVAPSLTPSASAAGCCSRPLARRLTTYAPGLQPSLTRHDHYHIITFIFAKIPTVTGHPYKY